MLTAQQFYDQVQHAIGNDPDARMSIWDLLNAAGRKVVCDNAWGWITSEPTTLTAVADQEWIALPDDFDRLLTVRASGTSYMTIKLSSMEEVEMYRGSMGGYTGNVLYLYPLMNMLNANASGGTGVRNRMEIYPTPTEDGSPTLVIVYLRKWVELNPSDPNFVPNIPEEFTSAIVYRARADAKILNNDEDAPKEEAMYAEEIMRLRRHELERSINRGTIRGGAGDRGMKRRLSYAFTSVTLP